MNSDNNQQSVSLTPKEISVLGEYRQAFQIALSTIIRVRGLKGKWGISPDGSELVRSE